MSVLLNREDSEQNKEQSNLNPVATSTPATRGASPLLVRHLSGGRSRDKATVLRPRDTVRLVNEKLSASTANVNEVINEPQSSYLSKGSKKPKNFYSFLPNHSMHAIYTLIQVNLIIKGFRIHKSSNIIIT